MHMHHNYMHLLPWCEGDMKICLAVTNPGRHFGVGVMEQYRCILVRYGWHLALSVTEYELYRTCYFFRTNQDFDNLRAFTWYTPSYQGMALSVCLAGRPQYLVRSRYPLLFPGIIRHGVLVHLGKAECCIPN